MTTSLVITCCAFVGFAISESTILTTPSDVPSCSGENVTIAWTYNPANLVSAVWTFTNGTLTDANILRKIATNPPTVPGSSPLNVEFIENGTIKLISTSPSYSGTYKFSIADTSANQESDSVNITINDVPQPLVIQENVITHTFTCSGSSSIPTVIRVSTSSGNFRYEASPYTSSVTTEGIECCYNGSAASCSNETFTATYDGTIYCQQVRDASTTVPPTLFTTTQMIQNTTDPWILWCLCNLLECILASVIPPLIVIGGCIAGAIFYCRSKEKCCFKKEESVPQVKVNEGKPPDGERIASASHVEMGDISSEKSSFVPKGLSGIHSGRSAGTGIRVLSTTDETLNETSHETNLSRTTVHVDNQVNDKTKGRRNLPPIIGNAKVVPDGNPEKNTAGQITEVNNTHRALPKPPGIGSEVSSQEPNMGDVEANKQKRKKKKKKKSKETEKDQIV